MTFMQWRHCRRPFRRGLHAQPHWGGEGEEETRAAASNNGWEYSYILHCIGVCSVLV